MGNIFIEGIYVMVYEGGCTTPGHLPCWKADIAPKKDQNDQKDLNDIIGVFYVLLVPLVLLRNAPLS